MAGARKRIDLSTLDDGRFVDLVAALIYPLMGWGELRRFGSGPATLANLIGREVLDRGAHRDWWVRVLPAQSFLQTARTLCTDIAALEAKPDVLLLATSHDPSQREIESVSADAVDAGVKSPLIWGRTAIDRMLRMERPDLLFAFLGISSSRRIRMRVRSTRRRTAVKRLLHEQLMLPPQERPKATAQPYEKMRYSKLVLRSVDDDSYPGLTKVLGTNAGWARVGTYDFYHNGVEVIIGVVDVVVDASGCWKPIAARERFDATRYRRLRAFEVGRIPYANIVSCDPMGDEYHREPHLFCTYANGGQPYEDYRYYSVTDPFRIVLDPERMLGDVAGGVEERRAGDSRA